jgi:hypothetical protein
LVIEIPRRVGTGLYRAAAALVLGLARLVAGLLRLSARQYAMLGLAAVCIGLAGVQLPGLDQARSALRETTIVGGAVEHDAPPDIVLLTHALGGFKVVFIDLVWLRAVRLLNGKQFWELSQLYDWIGKLEPRLEEVWVFNGWNMAYNIVAELSESEPRWQWIARAIAWMRDDGWHKYNRRSAEILREIAWTFYNKIGATNDEHNIYYKHRWALIMDDLLGPEGHHDWKALRDMPQSLGAFVSQPALADFLVELWRKRIGNAGHSALIEAGRNALKPVGEAQAYRELPKDVRDLLDQPRHQEAKKLIHGSIVARVLREVYKIDVGLMADIEQEYGAMDWRLPDPHAIYWSKLSNIIQTARAMAVTEDSIRKKYSDKTVNPERMIFYSLKQLYRRGRIAYMDPVPTGNIALTYNLQRIDLLHNYYIKRIEEMQRDQDVLDRIWRELKKAGQSAIPQDVIGLSTAKDGHVYFLQEVSEMLYYSGDVRRATMYFKYGQDKYDKFRAPDGRPYTLEEYCLGKIRKLLTEYGTREQVLVLINGMVLRYYFLTACFQDDEAASWYGKSREWWRYYVDDAIQRAQARMTPEAMGLPTHEQLCRTVLHRIMTGQAAFPPFLRQRLRERMNLPDDWEQKVAGKLGEAGKAEEKLRAESYDKAVKPLPSEKPKSAVEEEEEKRKQDEEKRRASEEAERRERREHGR